MTMSSNSSVSEAEVFFWTVGENVWATEAETGFDGSGTEECISF